MLGEFEPLVCDGYTILAHNSLNWTPLAVTVGQFARKTFVVSVTRKVMQ
jgi:hypothetical protein